MQTLFLTQHTNITPNLPHPPFTYFQPSSDTPPTNGQLVHVIG